MSQNLSSRSHRSKEVSNTSHQTKNRDIIGVIQMCIDTACEAQWLVREQREDVSRTLFSVTNSADPTILHIKVLTEIANFINIHIHNPVHSRLGNRAIPMSEAIGNL